MPAPIRREPRNTNANSPVAFVMFPAVTSTSRNPVITLRRNGSVRKLTQHVDFAPKERDCDGVIKYALTKHVGIEIMFYLLLLEQRQRRDGISGRDERAKDEALDERELGREASQRLARKISTEQMMSWVNNVRPGR